MRNLKVLPAAWSPPGIDNGPDTQIPSSRLTITGDGARLESLGLAPDGTSWGSSPPIAGSGLVRAGR